MSLELSPEFFHILYSLSKESEIIISDNEIFKELDLKTYIIKPNPDKFIDIKMEHISRLVYFYFKKVYNEDDHVMMYNHKTIYSHRDCKKYLELYYRHLLHYESTLISIITEHKYEDLYLNCDRINNQYLFIKPVNFEIFKQFINDYYEFIIRNLKTTIKYLEYNINLLKTPFQFEYFSASDLLEILTDINESLILKHTFHTFMEYGIPIKLSDKLNLINYILFIKYKKQDIIIDNKILLIEFYKYEYQYQLSHPAININDMISDEYSFKL